MKQPNYFDWAFELGEAWAQGHKGASPDDLGKRIDHHLRFMPHLPEEAKRAFREGFWKGASTILQ